MINFLLDLRKFFHPSSIFLFSLILITSFAYFWASNTELEEVIRAQGRVVPASKAKVVESEFPGKIDEIFVQVGDKVNANERLLSLKDTDFSTDFLINQEDFYMSLAAKQRLEGEILLSKPNFGDDITEMRPDIVSEQLKIFNSRLSTFQSEQSLILNEIEMFDAKIAEKELESERLRIEKRLVEEELTLLQPMVEKGYEPKIKLISIQQSISSFESRILRANAAIPGLKLEIERAKNSSENLKKKFIAKAQEELSQASDKFNKAYLRQVQLDQKLNNARILSPVTGTVSKVNISSQGEVISAGETLFEIIPLTDELVLEVEVRPEDVAFVYEGQKARISLTAFDPAIYGFLDGEVATLASNTAERPDGSKFFPTKVKTLNGVFDKVGRRFEIIPGMEASVEIKGENRSVLDYFLNPLQKIQREAFKEN
jgi:membrane fusion protein, adhesin transport system